MFNVWALQKENNLNYGSGQYRSLVVLPVGEKPITGLSDYTWVKIARNVDESEADAVMNQYPSVTKAKC